jgi:PmbA protein
MKRFIDKIEHMIAKKDVDDFEISAIESQRATIESKDKKADFISESDSRAFAVRLLKGNRLGYAYSMSDDDASLVAMVDGAVFAASYQDEDENVLLPEGPQVYPRVETSFCERPADLGRKIDFAVDLEMLTRSKDRRIRNVRYATLKESSFTFYLKSSRGILGEYGKSLYLAYVYAVAEEEGQSETGFSIEFAGTFEEIESLKDKVAEDAASRGLRMLGARRIKTGRYPVIIENGAMTELLGVLVPSFNGRNVALGKSMLAGQRGKKVFAEEISILDDPLIPGGTGTCPFDGEGVKSRKVEIIMEGTCREYLTDSYWGSKLGTGTTASLRRDNFKAGPDIGISNLYIEPGKADLGKIYGELGRGVLLTGFMGIHTADPVSGDFSVGASGIYFDGGETQYPVRTFAVSGNIVELLARVVARGRDLEMFGSTGSPSLAFEFIDVGGE